MYSVYLVNRMYTSEGYIKTLKNKKEVINGVEYRYNEPVLTTNPEKQYKTYANAEKKCWLLQEQIRRFCSNGRRYGWDWRNMYDMYVVDLDTNNCKRVVQAEIKDPGHLHEDVRLGLHGYY